MTSQITGSLWRRRLIAGFLTWLIPFLISIPFFGMDRTLVVDQMLFKSLMIVVGSLTAAILLVWFFAVVPGSFAREAAITGAVWLAMNWALDLVVLVGLMGMPPCDYATGIGLRYLVIPAMVIPAGIIADMAVERAGN
ncbi:MAG TPA: hypothetical protein HA272_02165 [Methanoregula sp.]|nr:hypothetical protein [Methanoregula sp.]